jgi:hypothetical protein
MTETTHRHGCNGKPRPAAKTLVVQDGYEPDNGLRFPDGRFHRTPRWKEVPVVFDLSICQKGMTDPDAGCTGCVHRRSEP